MTFNTVRHAFVAAVLALCVAPAGLEAATAPAPAAKPATTAKPAPTAKAPPAANNKLSANMPDSVLAKVFTGTGADQTHLVTQRQVVAAAARSGKRLDLLTPEDRRGFLEVLVDQVVLVARVKQEPRRWDHRDSTDWNALRDRLVLRAALESAMADLAVERANRGDSALSPQEMGMVLRDRAIAQMAPVWNDKALLKAVSVFDTLPKPDSRMSMIEQMRVAGAKPNVNETDAALVLVESAEGRFTLGELVRDYGRLNPIYRPRVETVDDVKGMVGNALYESQLRRVGIERGYERKPNVAAQLAQRAEYLDVSKFVTREVYAKIATDTMSLQRHYQATKSQYDWDESAAVLTLSLGTRHEADSVRRILLDSAQAESLLARSTRAGAPFRTTITRASDTTLFSRLKRGGVGSVVGPDSTVQGWRTMRALSFQPRRPRTYAEAEPLVKQSWYDLEGERLMRQMLDGLRKRAVVVVNERSLAKPLPIPPVVGR